MRLLNAALCTIGLATAMHLDWHVARPVVHEHSLGLSWHWLLAIPVFAVIAWCVHRAWPTQALFASAIIIGIASLLAAIVEPAWEVWVGGATREWAFGRERLVAFGAFLATGLLTQAAVLALARRRFASTAQAAR